jgi:N-acetylated-alpha-linked acidic dipeptidase
MLAEAKSIGAMLKSGWKPKRTLVYASWDGEEPGLLGSTEWVETHADELQKKAVLYINSDTNTRGFLNAEGSHSLQRFINEVAASVQDPETGVTVQQRQRARLQVRAYEKGASDSVKKAAKKAAEGGDLYIGALGSGSDFSPFLQHLGLAALSIEYSGEDDQGGVYHSRYDTFEHYLRFGDPQFAYGIAEAQTVGRAVLRMADADVLPMQFGGFADMMADYLDELHKLMEEKRRKSEDLARLIDKKLFAIAADPTRVVSAPEREPEVPFLDFAPLDNVMARLKKSAKAYDDAYSRMASLSPAKRRELNAQLRGLEQTLAPPKGLPGREWYRHLVYAPGLLTGYGVKTLPGVREAIEDNRFDEANQYIMITAAAFTAYCDLLDRATKSL